MLATSREEGALIDTDDEIREYLDLVGKEEKRKRRRKFNSPRLTEVQRAAIMEDLLKCPGSRRYLSRKHGVSIATILNLEKKLNGDA